MTRALLRRTSAAAIAALTLALGAASATADDVVNDLDATIDPAAEVMPLTVGGADGTTTLSIVERNGDGKNGCNLTGQTVLTVSVTSSDPSKATVSPSSVTFTSCGATREVTVHAVAEGSSTVTLVAKSNTTGGSFDLAPATFRVDVSAATPTNTAPTVEVTGVTSGTAYEFGSVPDAMCQVTDAEDGDSSFPATLSAVTGGPAAGLGQQTATCAYTDAGGLEAVSSVTYSVVDTTAPVITRVSRLPGANPAGWNNADVTVTWSCSDTFLDEAASVTSRTVTSQGADQSATGTCTDLSGNSVSDTVSGISIDTTAPTIAAALSPSRPATAWWNIGSGAPTVTYTCGDELSGVASCTDAHTFGEGADQSHSGSVVDAAGNSATTGVSDVDVDLTAPGVTWVGGPADGGAYYFGPVPAAGTCDATDALSGPGACTVSGHATSVGTHTLTASAKDVAGNTTTAQRDYEVLAWTLKGFYQPVDMGGVWNTVKNGSTVPLKFEVFAGATELTDTAVVDTFTVTKVSCSTAGGSDDVELTTSGNTVLRYDASGGQFIQNWQTPKSAGACYKVTMTTDDGSATSALFRLK
ncbi:PxKF domain-containing protein [Knoellia sp. CPCC 206450]|uniref:PxKF domain-containing protein n=1 Tax=Knoellia tibetensis TaxID=3404798 RepID=UPI003B42FED1